MEFLFHYGLFIAKGLTLIVLIVFAVAVVGGLVNRKKSPVKGQITVTNLNDLYQDMYDSVDQVLLSDAELKQAHKDRQKADKQTAKEEKKRLKSGDHKSEPRLFVLDFDGDVKASQVDQLRQVVSAVLHSATEKDEILLRLESPGGMVHGYGLAASQLDRIKAKGIKLTVSVDKVAASGGYMMACVAETIIAAPFAVLGSIGVVAQLPNFHRFLKKHDVDYEILTAGEYKRTLTMFGENTEKGRAKFLEELEITHDLFKDFVHTRRPSLDISAVATGEAWFGQKALENGLIDEICTSDQYITERLDQYKVIGLQYTLKKNVVDRISGAAEGAVDNLALKWVSRLWPNRPQV